MDGKERDKGDVQTTEHVCILCPGERGPAGTEHAGLLPAPLPAVPQPPPAAPTRPARRGPQDLRQDQQRQQAGGLRLDPEEGVDENRDSVWRRRSKERDEGRVARVTCDEILHLDLDDVAAPLSLHLWLSHPSHSPQKHTSAHFTASSVGQYGDTPL